MNEQSEDKRGESLTPLELETEGVLDEAAAMNRGKLGQLLGLGALAVATAVGGTFLLGDMDEKQALADAGSVVDALTEDHFDAFWRCALPGIPRNQVGTPIKLGTAIERLSERSGRQYANQVRKCREQHLDPLGPQVTAAGVPVELQPHMDALAAATATLRRSWNDHLAYLDKGSYATDDARPLVAAIAASRDGYDEAHQKLNEAIREATK